MPRYKGNGRHEDAGKSQYQTMPFFALDFTL